MFAEYLLGSRSSINVGYVGQQVDAPGDADRRQPAAARHGRPEHLAAGAAAPPALPVQPGHHVDQHDGVARPQSNYNALQTTFKQRLWQGLDFVANYTLGRAMANNSGYFGNAGVAGEGAYPMNSYDIEANYGPAAYDARHIFSLAGSYELPFGKERQFGATGTARSTRSPAAGRSSFAVTAHTGFPITVHGRVEPVAAGLALARAAQSDRQR